MEPFAVTVETATSLPEAPATRDDLALCAPVKCLVRWAGMPVATVEATFGETDWVASWTRTAVQDRALSRRSVFPTERRTTSTKKSLARTPRREASTATRPERTRAM
jgi:hypothetical protein